MPRSKNNRRKKSGKSRLARQADIFHAWMRESNGADENGRFEWKANLPWDTCEVLLQTERRWMIEISVWVKDGEPMVEMLTTNRCLLSDLEATYHETKTRLSLEAVDAGHEITDRGWDLWVLTGKREKQLKENT